MTEKPNIIKLIKHIASNDYSKADQALAAIVNEKLKRRIVAADQKITSGGNK